MVEVVDEVGMAIQDIMYLPEKEEKYIIRNVLSKV